MKLLLWILVFFEFTSCGQSYKTTFKANSEYYLMLKKDLSSKLAKWNSKEVNTRDFDVNVQSIVLKGNYIGIYNYFASGSHHSGCNFFTFDGQTLKILDTSDTASFKNKLKKFLNDQKFSQEKETQCLEKIDKLLSHKTGDSF